MTVEELEKDLAARQERENAVSLYRRLLHGRIDLLRPVLVERLKASVAAGDSPTVDLGQGGRAIFEGTGESPDVEGDLGPMPDVDAMSTADLRAYIRELERVEDDVSLERRVLQGEIDILRAELERRRSGQPGIDLDDLGKILGGGPGA